MKGERRRRLAELDNLLEELELLNLVEQGHVPEHLAVKLEKEGIPAAARKRPLELIEAVFKLQRPYLRCNPASERAHSTPTLRINAPAGWVFV